MKRIVVLFLLKKKLDRKFKNQIYWVTWTFTWKEDDVDIKKNLMALGGSLNTTRV
jgi:hypothetical protein